MLHCQCVDVVFIVLPGLFCGVDGVGGSCDLSWIEQNKAELSMNEAQAGGSFRTRA